MKIKLSKYWWGHLYLMLGQWVIMEFILLYFFVESLQDDKAIFGGLMVTWSFISIYAALSPPKVFFMIVEIQNHVIKAFLFGKLKCEVFLKEEVYYAIINSKESVLANINKTYIVISNTAFELKTGKKGCTFLNYYDKKMQIIIPYDKNTKYLFPIKKWTSIS